MADTTANTNAQGAATAGTQGDPAQNPNASQPQAQTQTGDNNTNTTAGDAGAKTYTQAELDALIEKRLARERKKYQQQPAPQQSTDPAASGTPAQPQQVNVDVTEEARQQAAAIIAQANQRLIQSIAQAEATKLNINPDYIADAVKLADLSAVKVNDDGTVDTKSVTTALEAVLQRMPVLKATAEAPAGGFKVGGQGNNGAQTSSWGNSAKVPGESKRWNKNRY